MKFIVTDQIPKIISIACDDVKTAIKAAIQDYFLYSTSAREPNYKWSDLFEIPTAILNKHGITYEDAPIYMKNKCIYDIVNKNQALF